MTCHAIAATKDGVWLATSFGLWFEPAQPARSSSRLQVGPSQPVEEERGLFVRGPPWWSFLLPRVDIGFVSARSSRRHDVRAFALLTFTFDRNLAGALERAGLLARLAAAQRDRTLSSSRESSAPESRIDENDPFLRIQETSP
jgi:hypothetical protein